jgi:hypothetical protein
MRQISPTRSCHTGEVRLLPLRLGVRYASAQCGIFRVRRQRKPAALASRMQDTTETVIAGCNLFGVEVSPDWLQSAEPQQSRQEAGRARAGVQTSHKTEALSRFRTD